MVYKENAPTEYIKVKLYLNNIFFIILYYKLYNLII